MGSKVLLEFCPSQNVNSNSREAAEQSRAVKQNFPTSWEAGEHGGAPSQDQEGEGGPWVRALCWQQLRQEHRQ